MLVKESGAVSSSHVQLNVYPLFDVKLQILCIEGKVRPTQYNSRQVLSEKVGYADV